MVFYEWNHSQIVVLSEKLEEKMGGRIGNQLVECIGVGACLLLIAAISGTVSASEPPQEIIGKTARQWS